MGSWPSGGWRMTLLLAALLAGAAAACGLAVNALSSDPLPLSGPGATFAVGDLSLEQAVVAHAGGAVFVDARAAAAYRAGHVAGALSVPYTARFAALGELRRRVPPGDPVVVYCTGPGCPAAARLAAWMVARGWRHVHVFGAGYPVWEAARRPVQTGAGTEPRP
jgi:3-mercaptopyruvate sulfurtransferase SseA